MYQVQVPLGDDLIRLHSKALLLHPALTPAPHGDPINILVNAGLKLYIPFGECVSNRPISTLRERISVRQIPGGCPILSNRSRYWLAARPIGLLTRPSAGCLFYRLAMALSNINQQLLVYLTNLIMCVSEWNLPKWQCHCFFKSYTSNRLSSLMLPTARGSFVLLIASSNINQHLTYF